jgi:hypothetical protein
MAIRKSAAAAARKRATRKAVGAKKKTVATQKASSAASRKRAAAPKRKAPKAKKAGPKTANRRDGSARKRKTKVAERPVLAFVGDAARWTVSPLASPAFQVIARRIIGAAMLPLGWVSFETFLRSFGHAALEGTFWRTSELWFFGIGLVMWLVLFFGLRGRAMLWLYVAGHELTHAFFVLLSGGNVGGVHVTAEGGHVLTNKSNLMIVLSPYFVPFYTMIAIGLWWITGKFIPEWTQDRSQLLYAVIGFTWCFHVSFTAWMITREQPDLHHYGRLFSIALIIWVNLALISGLLIAASPEVTLVDFTRAWWTNFTTFGSRLGMSLKEMVSVFF